MHWFSMKSRLYVICFCNVIFTFSYTKAKGNATRISFVYKESESVSILFHTCTHMAFKSLYKTGRLKAEKYRATSLNNHLQVSCSTEQSPDPPNTVLNARIYVAY